MKMGVACCLGAVAIATRQADDVADVP